jgi:hypothetical protein
MKRREQRLFVTGEREKEKSVCICVNPCPIAVARKARKGRTLFNPPFRGRREIYAGITDNV